MRYFSIQFLYIFQLSSEYLGVPQRTALGKPLVKSGRSRKSSTLDAHNSQSQIKEIQETTISKSREVGIKQAAGEVKGKQSDDKADLWWLNLPYVLVCNLKLCMVNSFLLRISSALLTFKKIPDVSLCSRSDKFYFSVVRHLETKENQ